MAKSVAFYETLFGEPPAKLRGDYAKFEPSEPPLVLSLEPAAHSGGGALNHVGIRLPHAKVLVAMQMRLEAAGLHSQREEGVECCYAKQTKFWLHDPDGTLWELYTLEGDIEHRGEGQREEVVLNTPSTARKIDWEHRMGSPIPEQIPLVQATADEVRLRGTFNLTLTPKERTDILRESHNVLKPGGRLYVHVLTGDQPVDGPDLSGPASVVRFVPTHTDVLAWLQEAGFTGAKFLKYDAKPCFVRNGIAMRETQIEAFTAVGNR